SPELDYDDNQESSVTLTISEYLGTPNDDILDFGAIVADGPAGQSASTYLTLRNNTDEPASAVNTITINSVSLEGGSGTFSVPQINDSDFSSNHGLFGWFYNSTISRGPSSAERELTPGEESNILVRFDPLSTTVNYSGNLLIEYSIGTGAKKTTHTTTVPLKGIGQTYAPSVEAQLVNVPPLYVITPEGGADGARWASAMKEAIRRVDPWFRNTTSADAYFITAPN